METHQEYQKMALKRLTSELKDLTSPTQQRMPSSWQTSTVDDDMFHWRVKMPGPPHSTYKNGTFLIDLQFPEDGDKLGYPMYPPKVSFLTPIYHGNVNVQTGEIESELLGEHWTPALNPAKILTDPNPNLSPNRDATKFQNSCCKLFRLNRKEYYNIASLWS